MATRSLGTLTLDLVAKTGGFVQGMSKAERESAKWKRQVERNVKAAGKAIGVALAAGTAAAAAGLTLMVNRSREAIDIQAKMAQRLNTTSESLAVLKRATDRTGLSMKIVETAGRTLDISLGKASQGVGAQADAVKRLGINIEEVAALPLDQRITTINKALRDNVPAYERAAVAADLFGSRGAAAIQQIDPDTLALAAKEVEIFGLNLSEVDAAKVEQANDAFSTFSLVSDGIGQQLAVELAPVLRAVGEEFLKSAEEAGGLGNVVQDTVRGAVEVLAFMVNAVDGVGVAFRTVADGIIIWYSEAFAFLAGSGANVLAGLSYVPGLDFSEAERDLREFARTADGVSAEAQKAIQERLAEPLAGDRWLAFYDRAQAAGQAAAEATVEARAAASEYNGELGETVAALEKIEVTSKKIKVSDSFKEAVQLHKDYNALVRELSTEEERLQEQLNQRLALLEKVTFISDEAREKTLSRVAGAAFREAPDFGGLSPEVGGAFSEFDRINEAESQLEDWYSTQLDMLAKFRAEKSELNAQWDEQEAELAQQHADRINEIEQARQVVALTAAEDLFGNMAGLAKEFVGEQSVAYKALFALEKAAAIARSIVAIQTAIAQAATAGPFPANLAAMASVASATAGLISTISSTSIQGQAHDGMMSVPKTGSYVLEQGERVMPAETTARLDQTLNDIWQERDRQRGRDVSVGVINSIDPSEVGEAWAETASFDRYVMNSVRRNQRTIKALSA